MTKRGRKSHKVRIRRTRPDESTPRTRMRPCKAASPIIHAGHVQTLEDARGHGDVLIVGLNSDDSARRLKGPGRPVFSERERAEMVAALSAVDLVVIFPEDSSLPLIELLKPDVWVKGGDYVIDTVNQEERAFVESYGGRVALGRKVEGSSTTDVIARVKSLPES